MRPDTAAVTDYLGDAAMGVSPDEIARALSAEISAQAARCRVPAPADFSADLAEALCRRVARNLAMRGVPLGFYSDELGSTRLGSVDPEIRRLEAPYRKLVVG